MKRKWIMPLCTGLVGALLCTMGLIWAGWCRGVLPDQQAAKRWGSGYVQLSCYLPQDSALTLESVAAIRDTIDQKLEEDSALIEGSWYDVYSCQVGDVTVIGEKPGKKQLTLNLVSESYFRLHQRKLCSGNWLSAADVSTRRVVLSEDAAWQLYGSTDVAGQTLTMSQMICQVAGVVEMPDDFATRTVQGDQPPQIFMLYADYTAGQSERPAITAYEAILPELVEDYGMQLLEQAVAGVSGGEMDPESNNSGEDTQRQRYILVQNTDRFGPAQVWDYLIHHTDYLLHRSAIPYPDTENAALVVLHRVAMLTLLAAFGMLLMLIALGYTLICYRRQYLRQIRRIWRRLGRKLPSLQKPAHRQNNIDHTLQTHDLLSTERT